MSATDPRFQFGALVHAKAVHVTCLIDCHRRGYGSNNAKTKLLNGKICRVEMIPSSTKKRAVTLITADYFLGGNMIKTTTLNLISVKARHVSSVPNEGNGLGTESVNQNSVSVAATNQTSTAPKVNDPSQMPQNIDENNVNKIVAHAAFPVDTEEFPEEEDEEAVNKEVVNDAASQTGVATVHGMEWVRTSTNNPP